MLQRSGRTILATVTNLVSGAVLPARERFDRVTQARDWLVIHHTEANGNDKWIHEDSGRESHRRRRKRRRPWASVHSNRRQPRQSPRVPRIAKRGHQICPGHSADLGNDADILGHCAWRDRAGTLPPPAPSDRELPYHRAGRHERAHCKRRHKDERDRAKDDPTEESSESVIEDVDSEASEEDGASSEKSPAVGRGCRGAWV